MSGPNAFSMRRAISGVSAALARSRLGERGAAHLQDFRRPRHVKTEGFDDLGSDQVARMG